MGTRPGIKVPGQKVPDDGFAALLGCREGLMTLVPPSQGMWLHGVWEAKEAEAVCCLYFKRPNCASPDPAQVILPIFPLLPWGFTMKGVGTPRLFGGNIEWGSC